LARLPRDLLTHESTRVSVDDYFRLWRALEEEAADPTLPIRLGKAISPEAFHPAVFAALCSPDLVVAVKRIGEYKRLIAPMTKTIEERPSGYFVEMRWNDPHLQVPVSLSATELVFLTEIARIATRVNMAGRCGARCSPSSRLFDREAHELHRGESAGRRLGQSRGVVG
jgi:hypothetical protein